jgi:hypothetical protein
MPRGSRPGERRGGRQRGTPNRITALNNAALSAAAAGPNVSPLDFMLGLMRDPKVPTDLRIEMAVAAAPFVHIRPRSSRRERAAPTQPGSALGIGHASRFSDFSAQRVEAKLNAAVPRAAGGADLAPLDFLLSVMKDPDATTRQRIKAARVSALYLHPHAHPDDMPIVAEDPFGFDIDPVVARALRDDWWREYQLLQERLAQQKIFKSEDIPPGPEELELQARVAERVKTLRCPPGYGAGESMKDRDRLHAFFCRRISPPPYNILTEAEDAEEAHLRGRVAAYEARPEGPEGRARSRIFALGSRRFSRSGLSAAEQSELDELRNRYPDPPDDPNDPLYPSILAWRKASTERNPVKGLVGNRLAEK